MEPRDKPPELEIAVDGEGISPADVSIKHLSELLSAIASLIESTPGGAAVSAQVSLREIRVGSAALAMASEAPSWGGVATGVYGVIRTRGAHASPNQRRALGRLYRAGRIGSIRVGVRHLVDAPDEDFAPIHMAAPLETEPTRTNYGTVLYGRVVGVNLYQGRSAVKIEHLDGSREEFDVDMGLAERATRLFNRTVRAEVERAWDGDKGDGIAVRTLTPWSEIDFIEALDDARKEISAAHPNLNLDELFEEIDG